MLQDRAGLLKTVRDLSLFTAQCDDSSSSTFPPNDHLGEFHGPKSNPLRTYSGTFQPFFHQRPPALLGTLSVGEGAIGRRNVFTPYRASASCKIGSPSARRSELVRTLHHCFLSRGFVQQRQKRCRNHQSAQEKPHRGLSMPRHDLSATKQQPVGTIA